MTDAQYEAEINRASQLAFEKRQAAAGKPATSGAVRQSIAASNYVAALESLQKQGVPFEQAKVIAGERGTASAQQAAAQAARQESRNPQKELQRQQALKELRRETGVSNVGQSRAVNKAALAKLRRQEQPIQLTPAQQAIQTEERIRQQTLGPEERARVLSGEYTIEEREVDSFRPKGAINEIPITKTYLVDAEGNIVREATPEERSRLRAQQTALRVDDEEKGFFERRRIARESARTDVIRGSESEYVGTAIGVEASVLGTAEFIRNVVTSPVETIKSIPSGIVQTYRKAQKGDFSRVARTEGGYAAGFLVGEGAQFYVIKKIPRIVNVGVDVVRTRNLVEVPTRSVVAPEYFKGQKYPAIKKGQTAGELLQEFRKTGAGYTATTKPFDAVTKAGKGSSELYGVYQAPRVSPQFLRITGESEKAFSFRVLDTLRPTAVKITPQSFELAKGVKASQRSLASEKAVADFISKEAELGKSYVPFIKTEKEAVIPMGTPILESGKKNYFKFDGRRVVIQEAKAVGGVRKGSASAAPVEDFLKGYSYRGIGRTAMFSPLELSYSSKYGGYSSGIPPSSINSVSKGISSGISNAMKPSSSIVPKISSKSITSSAKTYASKTKSSSRLPFGYGGSSIVPPPTSFKIPPIKTRPGFRRGEPTKKPITQGGFRVLTRRFGQWKTIGVTNEIQKAINIGVDETSKTLGRSFKVEKIGGGTAKVGLPFGYRYSKINPDVIVEKSKYALSKPSEIKEIQYFKAKKKKKKKGFDWKDYV